jgi:hypothetical protein
MEISLGSGRLMGAFNAGVAGGAWGDLPMPGLSNPRVRFGSPSADGVSMACAWRPRRGPVAASSVSSGARIRPGQWWFTGTTGRSRCYLNAINRS